jgi:hypothetical protein
MHCGARLPAHSAYVARFETPKGALVAIQGDEFFEFLSRASEVGPRSTGRIGAHSAVVDARFGFYFTALKCLELKADNQ